MKSFLDNRPAVWQGILSGFFISTLLIFACGILHAHDVRTESNCHHVLIRLSPRFVELDYILIQSELEDTCEMVAVNVNGDFEITEEEKSALFREKAASILHDIDMTLNKSPLDLKTVRTDYTHPRIRRFCYRACIPDGMTGPYRLIAKSRFPYNDDENFRYYIQTRNSIRVLNMELSGIASRAKGPAFHDPPVLEMDFNDGITVGKAYDNSTPVNIALRDKAGTTLTGQAQSGSASGIDKLKKMMLSEKLSYRVIIIAIVMATIFGGLHALTPGHGKTIVAAYLIGTRGRIVDAVTLALVTTFTHTFSVILLGLITLFASRYILPKQLLPFVELTSGVLVVGIGTWLLIKRIKSPTGFEAHGHRHARTGAYNTKYSHSRNHCDNHNNSHPHHHHHPHHHDHHHDPDHNHDHLHSHDHNHNHNHEFDDLEDHAHGHFHSPYVLREDEAKEKRVETVNRKRGHLATLVSLGFSGGLVPCIDALILLLIAVAINRIALGLFILVAFSLGLASVLMTIGILMVVARPFAERFSGGKVLRFLPVASLSVIIVVGLFMTVTSVASII